MNIKSELDVLGLNPDNSAVIGSGILSALNLRESAVSEEGSDGY